MAAPKVQALNDIIASLNPAFQADKSLISAQQKGLNNKYGSQRMALDAAKVQGFNDINTQATGKGIAFSGIPESEQANYLSTKYLPGMQGLNEQQNTESMSLQSALNSINKEQRLRALDTRQTQQSALETYLENERQRQFTAQQNALERAAAASNAAAGRASQQEQGVPAGLIGGVRNLFEKKKGRDSFVSPETFRQGLSQWISQGGSPSSFVDAFGGYVNPVHQERFGGYY